jgi:hypothetical protein
MLAGCVGAIDDSSADLAAGGRADAAAARRRLTAECTDFGATAQRIFDETSRRYYEPKGSGKFHPAIALLHTCMKLALDSGADMRSLRDDSFAPPGLTTALGAAVKRNDEKMMLFYLGYRSRLDLNFNGFYVNFEGRRVEGDNVAFAAEAGHALALRILFENDAKVATGPYGPLEMWARKWSQAALGDSEPDRDDSGVLELLLPKCAKWDRNAGALTVAGTFRPEDIPYSYWKWSSPPGLASAQKIAENQAVILRFDEQRIWLPGLLDNLRRLNAQAALTGKHRSLVLHTNLLINFASARGLYAGPRFQAL